MNNPCTRAIETNGHTTTKWSVGGQLLEALAARDFASFSDCFEPAATMWALLPSGPAENHGVEQITERFKYWFGQAEEFEVLNGTVGDVGNRLHVSWRLRLHPTPKGAVDWHVLEQQAYLRAHERIDHLDLLCSGFLPDGTRAQQ